MRCDDGRTWKEHPIVTTDEAVQKCVSGNFEGEGDYLSLVYGRTASSFIHFSECVCVCVLRTSTDGLY